MRNLWLLSILCQIDPKPLEINGYFPPIKTAVNPAVWWEDADLAHQIQNLLFTVLCSSDSSWNLCILLKIGISRRTLLLCLHAGFGGFFISTCKPHLLRFTTNRQQKRHIQNQQKELFLRNEVREVNFSLLPSTQLQYQTAGSQEVCNSPLWLRSYLRMILCFIFLT